MQAPSPCTHTISGSISLPFRGSFNLSLTVLVHYRSLDIFSLRRWTSHIQSEFHVFRPTQQTNYKVRVTWHTRLSLSLAELSNSFCSRREFFTLCKPMVGFASLCSAWNSDCSSVQLPQKGICMLQPPLSIHLPTYPPRSLVRISDESSMNSKVNKWKLKKFGLYRFRSPLLPASLFTFFFLGVLRCFSSPGYRSPILYIQIGAI